MVESLRNHCAEGFLQRVAEAYQREVVGPRCRSCRTPCCRLETLVLELDWTRLKGLWGLAVSRREFDECLSRGLGPTEIRAQDGLYYAYRRTCPAYDVRRRLCRVYDGPLKPLGCSDFPVYEEAGHLAADLRCEAVDPAALEARLGQAAGGSVPVIVTEDPRFPFLVTLTVGCVPKTSRNRRARGTRDRA